MAAEKEAMGTIRVKRVYEPLSPDDGTRFLVERLWPRGFKKDALRLDGWLKEAAPSATLRRWFAHDPAKWDEFQRRYVAELDGSPDAWQPIVAAASQGTVTLLYSARDEQRNSAVVLARYLEEHLGKRA